MLYFCIFSNFKKLHDEVCQVRNIVVDLKSTLDLKGSNHQQPLQHIQQQLQQPLQHKQQALQHTQRSNTTMETNSKKLRPLNRSTKSLLEKKQLDILERLNKTIEQLSNKVVSVENKQQHQQQQSPSNSHLQSHSPVTPSVSYYLDDNDDLNSSEHHTDADEGLTPRLEKLNKQVNRIQNSMAGNPLPKRHLNNDNNKLLHQSSLVKNLENKLNGLETRLDKSNNNKEEQFGKKEPSCSPLPGKPRLSSTKYINRYSFAFIVIKNITARTQCLSATYVGRLVTSQNHILYTNLGTIGN